ncbi:hypothetical protein F4825DRAFT_417063 [Nemania diffusa]|nr:hypothetical protein F4825DRAFT_417063 [Nemania diffusa]
MLRGPILAYVATYVGTESICAQTATFLDINCLLLDIDIYQSLRFIPITGSGLQIILVPIEAVNSSAVSGVSLVNY